MKAFFFGCILLAAGVLSVSAQSTITFENRIPGVLVAPFYGPEPSDPTIARVGNTAQGLPAGTQTYGGALLAGSSWRAQLLAAPGAVAESALVLAGPSTTFQTGSAAGFIVPMTFVLPNVPVGAPLATFQACIWNDPGGLFPTWSQASAAWLAGDIAAAKSPLFFAPPASTTSFLESFNAWLVPEPGGPSLLLLGAGLGMTVARRLRASSEA